MFTTAQIFFSFVIFGRILSAHPLCPGTEWNCKCDLEQTNDPPTENANIHTPAPPLGLEGNPYHTHQLFTDRVSYIRHNTRQLGAQTAEYQAQSIVRTALKKNAKDSPLKGQKVQCEIDGQQVDVHITEKGLKHCANDLLGDKDFWLKNEIVANINVWLLKATNAGKQKSDSKHNKRRETIQLKNDTDFFYYRIVDVPDGSSLRFSIGHYRANLSDKTKADKYYLYAVTRVK